MFEQVGVTATYTTWTEEVKERLPSGKLEGINAGQAKTTDAHCSVELERTSVLLCPRNLTAK